MRSGFVQAFVTQYICLNRNSYASASVMIERDRMYDQKKTTKRRKKVQNHSIEDIKSEIP